MMDIGEHMIAHYVYCNECKDSLINDCVAGIGEHFVAIYYLLFTICIAISAKILW